MRKVFSGIFLSVLLCSIFFACQPPNPGTTDNVVIELGESETFTEAELHAAVNCVLEEFKDYDDCDLRRIWYNDAQGKRGESGTKMTLYGDFYVNPDYREIGFEPDTFYSDWAWELYRSDLTGNWRIVNFGYG